MGIQTLKKIGGELVLGKKPSDQVQHRTKASY